MRKKCFIFRQKIENLKKLREKSDYFLIRQDTKVQMKGGLLSSANEYIKVPLHLFRLF